MRDTSIAAQLVILAIGRILLGWRAAVALTFLDSINIRTMANVKRIIEIHGGSIRVRE